MSIAFFIAGNVNATVIKLSSETANLKTVKVEKIETVEKLVDGKIFFLIRYSGRCLDGTTFIFLLIREKKLKRLLMDIVLQ